MTHKNIFPSEIMEFTTEYHFQHHHTKSRLLYQLILLFLVLGFASLFFIRAGVSVSSAGMLMAATERNTVKAPVGGKIQNVFVRENQSIQAGEVLLTLQADALEGQYAYAVSRQRELSGRIADLKQLVAIRQEENPSLSLKTPLYTQQYNLFRQQLAEAGLQLSNARGQYDRQKKLHDQGVISDAEFDQYNYELKNAETRLHLVYDKQISTWQTEHNNLTLELRELASQREQFDQEKEFYTIKAPVSGTIQNFTGVRPGSFVTLGETLAVISPDSGLIAEVQVLPRDIGLLKEGMPVRLQVDAFNYNEWGVVEGSISDISNDVFIPQNSTPVFMVKCRLDKHSLNLSNGYKGKLKKGMGVQARFMVAQRTLFQLLYDKADNWLNPAAGGSSSVAR